MTLREAHAVVGQRLALNPWLKEHASREAATLVLHVLRLSSTALYANPERPIAPAEWEQIDRLVARRLTLEPIQYILSEQEFYGLTFRVTPATLIPRPETELLVEAVLDRLPAESDLQVFDVGTGSGCIAIALARHLPQAHLLAVDLSIDALAIARQNAERHGVAHRIAFVVSDLLAEIPTEAAFDAIVSNPPYVPLVDRSSLHPQVRDFEPAQALFADDDGLAILRRLIPQALQALKPGGLFAAEFGFGQALRLTELLTGWHEVEVLDDLQGIPRVALARKPCSLANGCASMTD